ncbi:MAG: ABC transporter ATP-binding protein [Acidimicrobiales bacterium]
MHSTLTPDTSAPPATDRIRAVQRSAGSWEPIGTPTAFVEARDLTRVWGRGDGAQTAVDRVSLDLYPGEIVSIVGPSGSGKSTLGALLAGLDRPTSGSIISAGKRLDAMKDDALARWRASNVGIVFQDFHLLPTLTARENVELALKLKGQRRRRKAAALAALASVGLENRADRLPSQMSGGEQQRVGIARALSVKPNLLVADEPTGSLDQSSGQKVFELLLDAGSSGTTVVFITHDMALGMAASRVIHMTDGRISDIRVGEGR